MARAASRSSVRASVGVALRCLDEASAVRPECVATTRSAADRRRQTALAASTTASVTGKTCPARATLGPLPGPCPLAPGQLSTDQVQGAPEPYCENISFSA